MGLDHCFISFSTGQFKLCPGFEILKAIIFKIAMKKLSLQKYTVEIIAKSFHKEASK